MTKGTSKLLFMGTGCSSGIPNVCCLTLEKPTCRTCLASLTPEGRKNNRFNTSVLLQVDDGSGDRPKNILIDCGKHFYVSALKHFVEHKIRYLDAVILTHDHADAINGMDDLREWTLGFLQPSVKIYLTERTYKVIERSFPYMVNAKNATGGGSVPTFDFHVFSPDKPFKLDDINISVTPLPVHHGVYFIEGKESQTYFCMGFRVGDMSYISDCNYVPPTTKKLMEGSNVVVVDALKHEPYPSHFSFKQAEEFIASLEHVPSRVLYTGFSHKVEHNETVKELSVLKVPTEPAYDGQIVEFHV